MSAVKVFDPEQHPLHRKRKIILYALALLERLGLPVAATRERYDQLYDDLFRLPTEQDARFPLTPASSIEDHINGQSREELSCALVSGRKYSLTPGQRAILREWYGLTPTQLVVVERMEMFPHHPNLIRMVVLRSDVHITEDQRKHVLIHATIDSWGKFMDASITKGHELKEIAKAKYEAAYRAKCKAEGKEYLPPDERAALRAASAGKTRKPAGPTKTHEELMAEYD
jgi:hypothetical protein